ncbi:MAG: putative nucleoside-diphosphate-sugar epimerase [Hymenobacter sp.]|nr:putative nucleoside-diphosphate-sugar epimerase [Hymenobacter sp.]
MILIVGASGVLGQEAAHQLLRAGHRVRVLTREPARATALVEAGAEVVAGDLTDPTTLPPALRGVDTVLTAAHGLLGRGKYRSELVDDAGHRALIDAAREAGVGHFIYTSAYGASPTHPLDFYRTKYRVEQYLQQSGLPYTILRPSAFMEWHAHNLLGKSILEKGSTVVFGAGNNPTNFVAAHDIAQLLLQILPDQKARQRIITIGGPTNPTKNEVAALYGQRAGIVPKVRHLPLALLRAMAPVLRPFHPGISRVMQMGVWADEQGQTLDMADTLRTFPLALTTIEAFVEEQAVRHHEQLPAHRQAVRPLTT